MRHSKALDNTLNRETLAVTNFAGSYISHFFYIIDKVTGFHFLVDTGSEVSVIPPSLSERRQPANKLTLTAVNNTPIFTYGKCSLTLNLSLRRSFSWIFIVHCRGCAAANHWCWLPSPLWTTCRHEETEIGWCSNSPVCSCWVSRSHTSVKHKILHHIETTGPPVSARQRHLVPKRLRAAKAHSTTWHCPTIF